VHCRRTDCGGLEYSTTGSENVLAPTFKYLGPRVSTSRAFFDSISAMCGLTGKLFPAQRSRLRPPKDAFGSGGAWSADRQLEHPAGHMNLVGPPGPPYRHFRSTFYEGREQPCRAAQIRPAHHNTASYNKQQTAFIAWRSLGAAEILILPPISCSGLRPQRRGAEWPASPNREAQSRFPALPLISTRGAGFFLLQNPNGPTGSRPKHETNGGRPPTSFGRHSRASLGSP